MRLVQSRSLNVYSMPRKPKSSSSATAVTLHHVAARAGVSIATVSRALNGLAVSPDNHERVHRAAQQLGYVANEAARALRSERTHTMGVIFFDLRSTLGIELLDSLSEAIEDAGYSLVIATARGDGRRFELLMRRFLERRVDALFCIQAHGQGEVLAQYRAAGIPVLGLLTRADQLEGIPLIAPSVIDASQELASHLSSRSHRRVALLADGPYRSHLPVLRRALEASGLEVAEVAIPAKGGMAEVLHGLMGQAKRPTAVIAARAHVAALLTACEATGVSVPGALSLVSLGGAGSRGLDGRPISYLAFDPHRLGRAAGAAMLGWLAGVRPSHSHRVENGTFEAHATTGEAPPDD